MIIKNLKSDYLRSSSFKSKSGESCGRDVRLIRTVSEYDGDAGVILGVFGDSSKLRGLCCGVSRGLVRSVVNGCSLSPPPLVVVVVADVGCDGGSEEPIWVSFEICFVAKKS